MSTLSERIVGAIIDDLNDRSGCDLRELDEETQDEIRATWISKVQALQGHQAPRG